MKRRRGLASLHSCRFVSIRGPPSAFLPSAAPMTPIDLPHPPRRILIVKPSALGDVVHGLPVLKLLRKRFPRASIAWLVNPAFAGLLENHPDLDEVIVFPPPPARQHPRPRPAAGRRRVRPRHRLTGTLPQRLAGDADRGGGARRAGVGAGGGDGVLHPRRRVARRRAARGGAELGRRRGPGVRARAGGVRLRSDGGGSRVGRPRCCRTGRSRCCCRGRTGRPSGGRWSRSRRWSTRCAGGSGWHRWWPGRATLRRWPGAVDLVGKTSLKHLAALLERASLVVANDSGPMHIASALNRPLVVPFGPTNPTSHRPLRPPRVRAAPRPAVRPVLLAHLRPPKLPEAGWAWRRSWSTRRGNYGIPSSRERKPRSSAKSGAPSRKMVPRVAVLRDPCRIALVGHGSRSTATRGTKQVCASTREIWVAVRRRPGLPLSGYFGTSDCDQKTLTTSRRASSAKARPAGRRRRSRRRARGCRRRALPPPSSSTARRPSARRPLPRRRSR